MQVHFQFLSQTLQKVQPVAQSCLAEALAQAQERSANIRAQSSELGQLTELEEASRSWKGAAEVCQHEDEGCIELSKSVFPKPGPRSELQLISNELCGKWSVRI